jgi:Peptidase family M23
MQRLIFLFLLLPLSVSAQEFPHPDYPQHYFRDPLNIPIILAGNFGELRPNHFHSGIDIKTEGRTGLAVHAAADGYISRVSVSNSGFGNAIYINHPNGYTTLYGHLERFASKLEAYVKEHQYAQKSWSIMLDIPPDLFPVKKGDFIAWSGTTGDAEAPHLHFEIRDTKTDKPLNPMLFGFDIKDNIPPAVYHIAVYNRSKSTYEQTPQQFVIRKINGEWTVPVHIIMANANQVGFGINTIDHQNGTHNTYGVYEVCLYDDGQPNIGFQLDDIGYDDSRYINAHIDYKTWKDGGPKYEQLFSLPGNKLDIYHDWDGNGTVDLSDGKVHHIKIIVKDAFLNTTEVQFDIQRNPAYRPQPQPYCAVPMYPGSKDIFKNGDVSFYLDENALYDQICFRFKDIPTGDPRLYSDIYQLYTAAVPLNDSYTLHLRPTKPIPNNLHDKLVIVRRGKGETVVPATWDNEGWLSGDFGNFGDFSIQADDEPPTIVPLGVRNGAGLSHARRITFRIGDNLSGVKSYEAYLDGKWLLMAQFRNTIYYEFDGHCPPGNHELKIIVTDAVNNSKTYILHFKR